MVPPCASTMFLQIERPSPEPPVARDRLQVAKILRAAKQAEAILDLQLRQLGQVGEDLGEMGKLSHGNVLQDISPCNSLGRASGQLI